MTEQGRRGVLQQAAAAGGQSRALSAALAWAQWAGGSGGEGRGAGTDGRTPQGEAGPVGLTGMARRGVPGILLLMLVKRLLRISGLILCSFSFGSPRYGVYWLTFRFPTK